MTMIWAGIDAGNIHHHCVAIHEDGRRMLSRRVANDEPDLLELLTDVLALGETVAWGIDLPTAAPRWPSASSSTMPSQCTTSPAGPSTAPPRATAARARPTQRTPPSSPTRSASAATSTIIPATQMRQKGTPGIDRDQGENDRAVPTGLRWRAAVPYVSNVQGGDCARGCCRRVRARKRLVSAVTGLCLYRAVWDGVYAGSFGREGTWWRRKSIWSAMAVSNKGST